jgi:hypothetical protein
MLKSHKISNFNVIFAQNLSIIIKNNCVFKGKNEEYINLNGDFLKHKLTLF